MKRIIVISGPSGSGKTTISRKLSEKVPNSVLSISATSRKPRDYEKDRVDYFFVSEERFKRDIEQGKFIEWEKIHGHLYGTYRETIEKGLKDNMVLFMDIDPKGGLSIKKSYPDALLIFLKTISKEQLIKRLQMRNTETSEDISLRMKRVEEEMEISKKFDYIIENNNIDEVITEVISYAERD